MINDQGNYLADAQVVTTAAIGGGILDAGTKPAADHLQATNPVAATKDWGSGEPLAALCRISVANAAGSSLAFVLVQVLADAAAALTTAPVALAEYYIPVASALKDSLHRIGVLKPGTQSRYLGCKVSGLAADKSSAVTLTGGGAYSVFLKPDNKVGTPRNSVNAAL